ncbi:MAG: histidine--tRNA ligase [Alistipes sp.]|nr:histidine--tRNA ligase [Alistipes sp.]
MAVSKPSIPKGTRDFSPAEMSRRNYMFDVIKGVFRRHGFLPLETPAMENLSTLLGKYGEEGDKLLFRILNSGDFTRGLAADDLDNPSAMAPKISDKGLRYDLTVPFARYVVQHRNDIVFPFRRYQIQPVWRADRPQRGRYREFYQCDVDIVGSRSLLNEAELVQIVRQVFSQLGIAVTIKLNNRKILYGIAESIGHADRMTDITVAIDKIDKIGMDAVCEELRSKDIGEEALDSLKPILELRGSNDLKLKTLRQTIGHSETGMDGIGEMEKLLDYCAALGIDGNVEVDLSLARGLNYYTGTIFEVKANDFEIGSICGGGRYDDLTGIFGMPDTPGVGISFGADRIYDVMNGLGLFPDEATVSTKVLFLNFGPQEELASMKALAQLREAGIPSEIYPDNAKVKKQMEYANKRGIPFVVIIGSEELATGMAVVKDMRDGSQRTVPAGEIARLPEL